MKHKVKKTRRLKQPLLNVAYSMGKWNANDDYKLIQSMQQLSCLKATHQCVKFSRKFKIRELQERWYAILYDAPISKMILKNLQKLNNEEIQKLKLKAPFSDAENHLLLNIPSTKTPTLDELNELLTANRSTFHESRNANSLKNNWLYLKELNLLVDQQHQPQQQQQQQGGSNEDKDEKSNLNENLNTSFDERAKMLDDKDIMQNVCLNFEAEEEMCHKYRKIVSQIRKAETELFLWQILVEHITNSENAFNDIECLAVLKSVNDEFKIKSREFKIGRTSDSVSVDLDLSLIGNAKHVSRNQCTIKMNENCNFFIYNHSNKAIYVDGKILLKKCKTQLNDRSIIQIGDFSLLFFINYNTVIPIVNDKNKLVVTENTTINL